jgi:hypothetical protein
VLLLVSLVAASAMGASFIVPTDRELVRAAKGIVVATAQSSYVRAGEKGMINTVYVMRVQEVIKGEITSESIEVVEPGGYLNRRYVVVPGTPSFRAGERALIFMDMSSEGEWTAWSLTLGKFSFVRDVHGVRLLMRGQDDDAAVFGWDAAGNPYHEVIRSEEKFLQFVRAEACGTHSDISYTIDESQIALPKKIKPASNNLGFHACDYTDPVTVTGFGTFCGIRWHCMPSSDDSCSSGIFDQPGGGGSVGFRLVGTQAGVNGVAGVDAGMAAWNNDPLTNVNLSDSGPGSAAYSAGDGVSSIHFDDTADTTAAPPNGCGGSAIGCTRYGGAGDPFTFDGGQFLPMSDADVAFKAGLTTDQTFFNTVACHELGHALGLKHSDQGPDAVTTAVMTSNVANCPSCGANLQGWDTRAVETLYNPNPSGVCNPPGVPTVSANPSMISPGQSSQLTASASGSNPTFTWFTGSPGDTSHQVGTGTTITVSPATTTSYWVRATACSQSQNSATSVTVTVQCNPPTQANATANPTNVVSGGTSTITVAADGTGPLTYQLIQGSSPVGSPTTSASLVTPPLSATTTFLVQVTNACSTGPIRSNTVTITVTPCTPPSSATASANPQSIITGGTTQLSVATPNGTAPFNIQWFTGFPPGGTAITGANSATIVQSPSVTTTYYAQITNACGGPINSAAVTVTVASACTPPSNAVATAAPSSIQAGQTASLSVTANGTGLSIQWFTGTPPNGTAIPGAITSTVPVTPATTMTYFARVTGQCGTPSTIESNAVTITVAAACVDPSITTQPVSQTIISNTKATLKVVAAGTAPLHYQWYQGASGDKSKPVGTDAASFTTTVLTKKTQFWVEVRGNCTGDKRASSATATIDVKSPRGRPVGH